MRKNMLIVAAAVAVAFTAQATVTITPGTGQTAIGATANFVNTTQIGSTLTSPFSGGPLVNGTIISRVFDEGAANPLGGYTFVYDFSNLGSDTFSVITTTGWGALNTLNVGTDIPGAGFVATTYVAWLNPSTTQFSWANGLASPYQTEVWVQTSSRSTTRGSALVQNRENVDLIPIIVPVPEPTTMIAGAMLLLPFGASTLRLVRRQKTA